MKQASTVRMVGASESRPHFPTAVGIVGDGSSSLGLSELAQPATPCPADLPGPRMDWDGVWDDVPVADPHHGLVLIPDPYRWDTTI